MIFFVASKEAVMQWDNTSLADIWAAIKAKKYWIVAGVGLILLAFIVGLAH